MLLNIAPQITINGSESVSVMFEEEKGQLLLFSGGNRVSITDRDSNHLSEAILILIPGGDASMESLRLNTSALPQGIVAPQSNDQSEQGLLSITGYYELAEYESILSAVQYVSTNQNPDDTMEMRPIVVCQVRDAGTERWSNNLTVAINIVAFNDPPVIYLGGESQLNNSLTLNFILASLLITTRPQVHIQDPDTTRIQSIQIVLELETRNGDPIDVSRESLSSPSPVLREVNSTVYTSITSISHGTLPGTLQQIGYRNSDPLATINGTRVVRITAMDEDLVTNSGSRFPGMMSQPSFTFIRVGEEPPQCKKPWFKIIQESGLKILQLR